MGRPHLAEERVQNFDALNFRPKLRAGKTAVTLESYDHVNTNLLILSICNEVNATFDFVN